MSHSAQWFANRFIDETVSNDAQLSPIYGYQNQPVVSLAKALEPVQPLINNLADYIEVAQERCHYPNKHGLTKDQSASLYLYTMEWGSDSFYRVLNSALRTQDRSSLKTWFAFLKLFHTALKKLPHLKQNVWRGIRSTLSTDCKKGDELVWWSINSCSLDVHVIEQFLTTDSTLFLIEATNARDITGYTNYPNEHEVILLPGIRLIVVANSMQHTGGLQVIHLRETKMSEHSKGLPLISSETKSATKHGLKRTPSLQSKIVAGFRRACFTKPYISALIVLILVGLVTGVTVTLTRRNKTSVNASQAQDVFTIVTTTFPLPHSTNTISNSALSDPNNGTTCEQKFPIIGYVLCHRMGPVSRCAATDCDEASKVYDCSNYPADCYVIGPVIINGSSSNKWYRLNLKAGGYGYVNSVYCIGNFNPC